VATASRSASSTASNSSEKPAVPRNGQARLKHGVTSEVSPRKTKVMLNT